MRLFLICDNDDTLLGLRLAGIEGTMASDSETVKTALENALKDKEIGIVLINETLTKISSEEIDEFRKANNVPIIVEIPDKDSNGLNNSISEYVRKAIGINV